MKPLSPQQQRIWDLKQEGKTRDQIASALGISVNNVSKTLTVIHKKMGIKAKGGTKSTEEANPDKAAALIDAASEPRLIKLRDALVEAGYPMKAAAAYLARIRRRYPGVLQASRDLKTAELSDLLGQKIHASLQAMDEHVILEASYRDLALGTTAMIEKRQLLRGEPTQIISDHERKKLHELLPALTAEMQRRGITVEGEAEVVDPEPPVDKEKVES